MGLRGPVPNRSDDLARPRERKGSDVQPITKGVKRPATIPDADPDWHPIALMLWNSCIESGQADFYESSDYAVLYHVCEDLSRYKRSDKRSSMMFAALNQALSGLLVTEGDRRRVRLELEGEDTSEDEATDAVMDEYDKGLRLVV